MRYICSLSGGKDSTALLLMLIEMGYPLDEVVFFDTGWEFQAIYDTIFKLKTICEMHNIKFTILHPEKSFTYKMFEHQVVKRNGTKQQGYSWCGGSCRWGTTEKTRTMDKYCKDSVVYVGIAADEQERFERLTPPRKHRLSNGALQKNRLSITVIPTVLSSKNMSILTDTRLNIVCTIYSIEFLVGVVEIKISKSYETSIAIYRIIGIDSKIINLVHTFRIVKMVKQYLTLKSVSTRNWRS